MPGRACVWYSHVRQSFLISICLCQGQQRAGYTLLSFPWRKLQPGTLTAPQCWWTGKEQNPIRTTAGPWWAAQGWKIQYLAPKMTIANSETCPKSRAAAGQLLSRALQPPPCTNEKSPVYSQLALLQNPQ